jgi:hypothetical protein
MRQVRLSVTGVAAALNGIAGFRPPAALLAAESEGSQLGHCSFMRGFERDRQPRIVAIGLSPDGQKRQDQTRGAFFESRFKSVAIITVCAYIDFKPVAARIADVPETSEHTSIKRRVDHVQAQ